MSGLTLAHLLRYAELGWHIFPLSPNSKIPPKGSHGLSDATTDAAQITAWHAACPDANYGVNCGASGFLVLDVDTYKKGCSEALAALDIELGIPATLTVTTPNSGKHFYFKGVTSSSVERIGTGLDVRSAGGYVVVPECTIDGRPYQVVNAEPMAEAPQWLIDKAGKPIERSSEPLEAVAALDTDAAKSSVEYYLSTDATPAIEGQGGDAQTFRVASRCKDLGVSEVVAKELMAEHYNPRCEPPWDVEELDRKVENAYKYGQRPAAAASFEAAGFVPHVVHAEPDPFSQEPPVLDDISLSKTADGIAKKERKVRQWILGHDYMVGFVTLTMAQPGVGKSMITMLEALAIASGRELSGVTVKKPGRVWIYNLEDPEDELEMRLAGIAQYYNVDEKALQMVHYTGQDQKFRIAKSNHGEVLIDTAAVKRVIKHIKRHSIVLLCVDPLANVHDCVENSNDEMNKVMVAFADIARETGCAISIVHHSSKGSGNAGDMNKSRGASSVTGAARIVRHVVGMDEDMGKDYGVSPQAVGDYVGVFSAKASMSKEDGLPRWFEKVSVPIACVDGEESVGTVQPRQLARVKRENLMVVRDTLIRVIRDGYYGEEAIELDRLVEDVKEMSDLAPGEGKKVKRHIENVLGGGVLHIPGTDMKIKLVEEDGTTYLKIEKGVFDFLG